VPGFHCQYFVEVCRGDTSAHLCSPHQVAVRGIRGETNKWHESPEILPTHGRTYVAVVFKKKLIEEGGICEGDETASVMEAYPFLAPTLITRRFHLTKSQLCSPTGPQTGLY
jgi:hypothetical protein